MVLLAVKVLAGGEMQLVSAVGTEQQAEEQSLPSRFGRAAFVLPEFLHPFPYRFLYNRFLGVAENLLLLGGIVIPLFQLVGL